MSSQSSSNYSVRDALPFAGLTPIVLALAYLANSDSSRDSRVRPNNAAPTQTSEAPSQDDTPPQPELHEVLSRYWYGATVTDELPFEFKRNLQVIVYTLPDPEFRALAPMTDSQLAAFQLGLKWSKFLPTSIGPYGWPKTPHAKDEKAGASKPQTSSKPGIWLFHRTTADKGREAIAVLLVGEDPVGGINRPQLRSALTQAKTALMTSPNSSPEIILLGPTFSGGARSLRDEIDLHSGIQLRAASASASSQAIQETLRGVRWSQRAVVDPLSQALRIFTRDLGVKNEEIAILSEAHTLYGSGSPHSTNQADRKDEVAYSYLTRDLYAFRVAVNEDAKLFDRIFPSSKSKAGLRVPLKASASSGGMPTYAGETMAKSQEVTLDTFAKRLKAGHKRYLGILTTDRLDSLFLARYLSEEAPDLRIFLIGSDALFNVGVSRGSLTGVMTFSPYPVGTLSQDRLPYANDIAARVARTVHDLVERTKDENLEPKLTYVSVIGRGGEWPIARYEDVEGTPVRYEELESVEFRRGPLFGFVLTLVLVTSIPILRFLFSMFNIQAWPSEYLCRLAPYAGAPAGFKTGLQTIWKTLRDPESKSVSARLASALKLLIPNLSDRTVNGREAKRWFWLLVLFAITIVLWSALGFYAFQISLDKPDMRSWRLHSLANGVNPLIPLVCYLCALYALVWMRVRGRYIDNYTFHVLPSRRNGNSLILGEEPKIANRLKTEMQSGFSMIMLCTILVVTLMLVYAYDLWLRDVWPILEGANWGNLKGVEWGDRIWTVLAILTTAAALTSIIKTARIWTLFHNELIALEAHPIRNAFSRLPERLSWTSIWSFAGLRPQFTTLRLAHDFTSVLNRKPKYRNPYDDEFLRPAQGLLLSLYQLNFPRLEDVNLTLLQQAERTSQKICAYYASRLEPLWELSRLDGWWRKGIDPKPTGKEPVADALNHHTFDRDKWGSDDKLAEEFIAVMYASYIRYVFMQMRNIVGALAVSVSMLFIASYSYPFHPKGALSNSVTFLFAILAVVSTVIFYQMDHDPLLRRLAESESGKQDSGFFKRIFQFGLLPTLTFLASQVPELADALLRIVEIIPGLPK